MQFSLKKTYFIENSNGLGTLQAKPMYTCTCKPSPKYKGK